MEQELIINLITYTIAFAMLIGGFTFLGYSINKYMNKKGGL